MKAIFFRSCSATYKTAFELNGHETLFIEPLQFKYINLPVLAQRLKSADYDGIIFTSARAIEVISKCQSQDELSVWRERRIYAVGEASGNKLKELLDFNAYGLSSGNAETLAEFIISENAIGSKFLFPCGNLRTETMIEKLSKSGILVDPVTVYETEENVDLKRNLSFLQEEHNLLLYFFSPSGAEFVYTHLQSMGVDFSKYIFFAIGHSTCKKLEDLGIKVSGVATKPNAVCLLETTNNTIHN